MDYPLSVFQIVNAYIVNHHPIKLKINYLVPEHKLCSRVKHVTVSRLEKLLRF